MSNDALPRAARDLLAHYLGDCQNLGLILDKFAPWAADRRGNWDLTMRSTIRRGGENRIQTLTGGEAKGLWLSTSRNALRGESPSLFESTRTDAALMRAGQARWLEMVKAAKGRAFTLETTERLIAGLGASHVLETAITLQRNTGLPYLPGSSVKGLARAWGLIELAAQLGIKLAEQVKADAKDKEPQFALNALADVLMSEPTETLSNALQKLRPDISEDAEAYIQWFRLIFGWQGEAGAISFADAIIYAGDAAPGYTADVMTPHYVNYYTENGGQAPAEDDNPNPVSFIALERGQTFAFGLLPRAGAFTIFDPSERAERQATALDVVTDWLTKALTQMGIGSKTAAGYGFFRRKSLRTVADGG
jgi:CRISPR-associated protein Cmr6